MSSEWQPTIHVHGGEALLASLAAAGMPGERLAWNEVLVHGECPGGGDAARWIERRAASLATLTDEPVASLRAALAAQDAALAEAASRGAVVLWFGRELFCQAILIKCLAGLAAVGAPRGAGRAWLVSPPERPGAPGCSVSALHGAALHEAYAARAAVTSDHTALAARAWSAWTSPTPHALVTLALELASTPSAALPALGDALVRWLAELPASHDGLARSERLLLAALAGGPLDVRGLLARVAAAEVRPWLTDTLVVATLHRLAGASPALVALDVPAPSRLAARLTAAGEAVLAGRTRHATPPRWLGGTRVDATTPWRWDEQAARLAG